jgi:hypothetical protein
MSDLFDYRAETHARRTDPKTSHVAAIKAEPVAKAHCALILAHLKAIYPSGATVEEIGKATGLLPHKVGKRMSDLQNARHARPDETKTLSSGRSGRVWRAVP